MSANIINGREIAKQIREQIKNEVQSLKTEYQVIPGLAVILVGEHPASQSYVRAKAKACEEVGIHSEVFRYPSSITQDELIKKIEELNVRDDIHGILVQLPLPDHIDEQAVIDQINEDKDVDGFTPINVGNLVIQDEGLIPCTPYGIIQLIKQTGTEIAGKHAVVVGRSNIVGKPVAMLLLHENATVSICHSRTHNLQEITRLADILIVAVGKAKFITREYVKPGALVIDVGINRVENGQLVGDVDFEGVKNIASFITPVPGGVGPMTITMLLHNTVKAAKKSIVR
jgi:methylenetetrahydrofolate dehydrogenase (NADP+)/methenyltetrahydrofolate cyclohydrolase